MHHNKDAHKGETEHDGRRLSKTHIVMAIMVFLVVVACLLFIRSLRQELYEQRAYSLGQTTEKIVQIMNNVIDNEWDRLEYISHELGREPQATQEALLARLSDFYAIDNRLHSWKVSCIDSEGNLYGWSGQVDRWAYPALLLSACPNYQITIMEDRDSHNEQLVFLYRLPQPIHLTGENVVLTHTVLTLDMVTFGETLEVSAFEGSSYSYITEENGTRIYHQQNQNEFIAAYNILTALENAQFLFNGSYEEMAAAVTTNTAHIAEIERDGGRYFVAYAPLSVNEWNLFFFVPENDVGGSTDIDFLGRLLLQVGLIALLLIVMIGIYIRSNSRQTVARQQIAVDEAHRASQAKSDFLSHMSHDMRTPLNGIMGMCHIAQQNMGDGEAVADCLTKIDLSSRQLLALINDVLDMSRIEQDKVEIDRVPVDLNEIIRACSIHIEVSVYENKIVFERDVAGLRDPLVRADAVLLEKILTNILGNAAKFTPPEGRISLRVSETEAGPGRGVYQFEIEDTGVGMKPEFLAHLFEPFSQEHTGSRTRYQGTGLGLSIVKNLVDKLGGTIEVKSVYGEGSTFIVRLPLEHADPSEFPAEQEVALPFDGTGLRVLLVEDNELNCTIAKLILEECGLTVDVATNGAEAVERFQASRPCEYNIIFMDLRMPVMDGLEASRRIRDMARPDAIQVPIIALTADALIGDMEKTRSAGMNDHLGKPIELEKLYVVLRKYCPGGNKAE